MGKCGVNLVGINLDGRGARMSLQHQERIGPSALRRHGMPKSDALNLLGDRVRSYYLGDRAVESWVDSETYGGGWLNQPSM